MIQGWTGRFKNDHGHIYHLSPKYHCGLAGMGVEYGNGRSKWRYRKHCDGTTKGWRDNAKFSYSTKAIKHHHTMKYARKTRDFERSYRAGTASRDVAKHKKTFKTHRNMIDVHLKFITCD